MKKVKRKADKGFTPFTVTDPYTMEALAVAGFSMERLIRPVFLKKSSYLSGVPDGHECYGLKCTLHILGGYDVLIPDNDVVSVDKAGNIMWNKGGQDD